MISNSLFSKDAGKCFLQISKESSWQSMYPAGIYLLKVNNENNRTMC